MQAAPEPVRPSRSRKARNNDNGERRVASNTGESGLNVQRRPGWRWQHFVDQYENGGDILHLQVFLRAFRCHLAISDPDHGAPHDIGLDFSLLGGQLDIDFARVHAMIVQLGQFSLAARKVKRFVDGQDLVFAASEDGVLLNVATVEWIIALFGVAADCMSVVIAARTRATLTQAQDLVDFFSRVIPVVAHR